MTIPLATAVVNLNGTSKAELLEQVHNAYSDLNKAIETLGKMNPHGRDYQTANPQLYDRARKEHQERMAKIHSVINDVREIFVLINDQEEYYGKYIKTPS